jgi:hypothetical protein
MFDDLRPKGSVFEDEEEPVQEPGRGKSAADMPTLVGKTAPQPRRRAVQVPEIPILGMTAPQRLVIAIMVFLNVSVLGFFLVYAISFR